MDEDKEGEKRVAEIGIEAIDQLERIVYKTKIQNFFNIQVPYIVNNLLSDINRTHCIKQMKELMIKFQEEKDKVKLEDGAIIIAQYFQVSPYYQFLSSLFFPHFDL